MGGGQSPYYVSPRSFRSLWQEYRVYSNRVELECRVALHTLVIPANEILDIQVRPPIVVGDLLRGKGFRYLFALKIDYADGYRHSGPRSRSSPAAPAQHRLPQAR